MLVNGETEKGNPLLHSRTFTSEIETIKMIEMIFSFLSSIVPEEWELQLKPWASKAPDWEFSHVLLFLSFL